MYVESDRKLKSFNEETECKPILESYECDNILPHEVVAVVKREDCVMESLKLEVEDDLSRKNASGSCEQRSLLIKNRNAVAARKEKPSKRSVSVWECFACHKTYKASKTVRRHSKVCNLLEAPAKVTKERYYHKNEKNEFACDSCGKCFTSRQSVYAHIQRHIGQKVLCNICGKCFSNRNNLTKHHKTVHLKEKNYQCSTCEKRYDSSYRLRIHQNSHNGIRLFACPLCPQSFITTSALSRHKKTVHKQGELYECNVCFRKFNVAYNMRAHMVTHTGIKPHNCQYCKADFLRKHKLVAHLKEVHKVDCT